MLTIEECNRILNEEEQIYSRADIELLREFLYQLATIEFDNYVFEQQQATAVYEESCENLQEKLSEGN